MFFVAHQAVSLYILSSYLHDVNCFFRYFLRKLFSDFMESGHSQSASLPAYEALPLRDPPVGTLPADTSMSPLLCLYFYNLELKTV